MPVCKKCGIDKPTAAFRKSSNVASGIQGKCRICRSAELRALAMSDPEKERQRQERLRRSARGKARALRGAKISRLRHPEKAKARAAVKRALDRGLLVRPDTCKRCGIAPPKRYDGRSLIQAHHHHGYENPLDVEWLCHSCHQREHDAAISESAENTLEESK